MLHNSSLPTLGSTASAMIARAATAVSVPKAEPADSFVLHAPLELLARVQLLPYVHERSRAGALAMIDHLVDRYRAAGDGVCSPSPSQGPVHHRELLAAVTEGDQDLVDSLAVAWLPSVSAGEVVRLIGDGVVTSLAAAGHAPIALSLLLHDDTMPTTLLRGPLRALTAQPGWRVTWHERCAGEGDASLLYEALRSAPSLGRPGSDYIFPLMSQAQRPGMADSLLGPALAGDYDVRAALHTLTRVAAWSMLHDDPEQAPYGWSHALTMPQAVLSLVDSGVDPRTALAVAGTFALGFRLAHGTSTLPDRIEPVAATADPAEVATAAALHEDAHLTKYVLACLHAVRDDPGHRGLYLSAAARLVEWWRTNDAVSATST
ncbi:MAG: hypothetical protein WCC60_06925 [Ilumatobacteraceae bacterium]